MKFKAGGRGKKENSEAGVGGGGRRLSAERRTGQREAGTDRETAPSSAMSPLLAPAGQHPAGGPPGAGTGRRELPAAAAAPARGSGGLAARVPGNKNTVCGFGRMLRSPAPGLNWVFRFFLTWLCLLHLHIIYHKLYTHFYIFV